MSVLIYLDDEVGIGDLVRYVEKGVNGHRRAAEKTAWCRGVGAGGRRRTVFGFVLRARHIRARCTGVPQ